MSESYTDSFVAFIDILGFKQFIMRKNFCTCDSLFKDIYRYADLLLKSPNKDFTADMLNSVTINIISDSIVISVPKSTKCSLEILLLIVNTVMFNILIKYKLLCRGGIYEGDFCSNGSTAFGPALVQAYLLEENIAVYPRVVFPRHVYDVYYSICDDEKMVGYLSDLMQLETDEELFIADYIGFAMRRCCGGVLKHTMPKEVAQDSFMSIVSLIEDELACGTDKRVREKYIYMRDYYNIQLEILRATSKDPIPFYMRKVFGTDKGRE